MKKFIGFIMLFFFIISCDKKKEEVKELPTINFKIVDAYPLLPECESITNRGLQKACFYREIAKKIKYNLTQHKIDNPLLIDTIYAKIFIDNKGKSFFKNTNVSHPLLDSILKLSIQDLPIMSPAIKKGIPINIEFTLPIVVK